MALTPDEQAAKAAGWAIPEGTDLISEGDDAIRQNAVRGHRSTWARATAPPPGDVSTWVGMDLAGVYRVPTHVFVDPIPGRPDGAGPGYVTITPIGSTASVIEWAEFDGLRRTWKRTVGVGATGWTPVQALRRAGVALTAGQGPDTRVATDVGHALPMSFGVRVPRWRVHFRNTNDRVNGTISGALNVVGVSVGRMARTATGLPSQNFDPDTGKVIQFATTTPANGSELVTDWVEDYPLEPHTDYVLRYGFTGAAGQQIQYLQGGGWSITNGSGSVHSPSVVATQVKESPLDVWVEVEVPQDTPVWAYYGDSLTVGQSAALPVFDGWPAKHARAHGAIPTLYAHSGTAMSEWTNPLARRVVKYVTDLYLIDRADRLYWSMGSNDIFAEAATVQQMRDRLAAAWPVITSVTSTNVIFTTILPRHDPAHPQETVRQEWNRILQEELPAGALMTLDAAAAITAPSGDRLDTRWSASATDIHLNTPGYARFAAAIASGPDLTTRPTGTVVDARPWLAAPHYWLSATTLAVNGPSVTMTISARADADTPIPAGTIIGSVPAEYRPLNNVYGLGQNIGAEGMWFKPNGDISCPAVSAGSWFKASASWTR